MTRGNLFACSMVLCVAAGVTGVATAASGTPAGATTIKAVSSAPVMKVNRYVQDGLRWDKDVYTVKSGGTLHIVNDAADEGPHTFTVVARRTARRPASGDAATARSATSSGKAHGADPNSDAPPKFQYLENGVGQKTPPKVDRPGDSGVTGTGKKGESIDLKVTAPAGHEALLHVPDPSVDAGGGRRQLSNALCAVVRARGRWRSPGALASWRSLRQSPTRRRGAASRRTQRRLLGRRRAGRPGTSRPTATTRSWAWTIPPRSRSSRRSSIAATAPHWRKPDCRTRRGRAPTAC